MALAINDVRYIARCARCAHHIGDWALKLKPEDRLCRDHQKPKKIEQLGYKSTSTEAIEGKQ